MINEILKLLSERNFMLIDKVENTYQHKWINQTYVTLWKNGQGILYKKSFSLVNQDKYDEPFKTEIDLEKLLDKHGILK